MKKPLVYLVVLIIIIIGIVVAFSAFSKKSINSGGGLSECSLYSNKDGYADCMGLVNGKKKKCKFKIDNKVNEVTQQMEFTYTCLQK